MKRTKRFISVAAALSMLGSIITCVPTAAIGNGELLFNESFANYDSAKWQGESVGAVTENDADLYTTNAGGYDEITMPGVTVTDSYFSARFNAAVWSTDENAYIGMSLRKGDTGRYRLAYYPAAKQLKIEKIVSGAATVLDSCTVTLEAGKAYKLALSVKDGMLRAEVDDVVWLHAIDYTDMLTSGSATIESNLQSVTVTNPACTGEDRLFYDNFESGRVDSVFTNNPSVTAENGYIRVATEVQLRNTGFATSEAWEQTKVELNANLEGDNYIYIYTHSQAWNKRYRAFLHYNMANSTLAAQPSSTATTLSKILDDYKTLEIANVDRKYTMLTKKEGDSINLEFKIDDSTIMTATDSSLLSTAGGLDINAYAAAPLKIYDLAITDLQAATTTATALYNSGTTKLDDWEQTGTVQGVTGSEYVYKVTSGQNGVLTLKDKAWKNIGASVEVNPDDLTADGSYIALYIRYTDENNNVRLQRDKDSLDIIRKVSGTDTVIATAELTAPTGEFKMELQAVDGIYRGLIDGIVVAEGQAELTGDSNSGTVGLQAYNCGAEFDNFVGAEENRVWYKKWQGENTEYSFVPTYAENLEHTILTADVILPAKTEAKNQKSRIDIRNANSAADSYTAAYKLQFQVCTWGFYIELVDNITTTSFVTSNMVNDSIVKWGDVNRITVETEDLISGEVQIKVQLNGTEILNYTDDGTGLDDGYFPIAANRNGAYGIYPTTSNTTDFQVQETWIETVPAEKFVGAIEFNSSLTENGKLSATLTTTSGAANVVVFAALYDADGVLVQITEPVTAIASKESPVSTGELTLPADVTGYTAKAFCWDSLTGMKVLAGADVAR